MVKQHYRNLLSEVMQSQEEQGLYHLSYERIFQALSTGPALGADETEILWLSPTARAKYTHALKVLQAENSQRWQNKSWSQPQQQLAASTESDLYSLQFKGYKVIIERESDGFVISLILSEELRHSLPLSAHIELIDDQGEVWISGQPSEELFIMDDWPFSSDMSDYVTRAVKLVLKG